MKEQKDEITKLNKEILEIKEKTKDFKKKLKAKDEV